MKGDKAVLFSIQPRHVENIFEGRKDVEIRIHPPALFSGYKGYIYETQGPTETPWADEDGHLIFKGRGAVVGEFHVTSTTRHSAGFIPEDSYLMEMCLTMKELRAYQRGKGFAGIHLSNVVRYDRPREITEFRKPCPEYLYCESCAMWNGNKEICGNAALILKRAPQSWCYVIEL